MKQFILSTIVTVALCATACTIAGRDFVRADWEKLNYGEMTREQIIQEFGEPLHETPLEINNSSCTALVYDFGGPTVGTRTQVFYFFSNRLIGYFFTGDLKGAGIDPESFSKISLIQKGVTRMGQVDALFGKARGIFIYPMTKNKEDRTFVYAYLHGGFSRPDERMLIINYDTQGIVKDFKYSIILGLKSFLDFIVM